MDWSTGTHDHRPAPRSEPPKPTLLELSWQARSPRGRVLMCALYRGVAGRVEVRAGYGDQDLIRSELVPDVLTARDIAAGWKAAAIAKEFSEVPASVLTRPSRQFFQRGFTTMTMTKPKRPIGFSER